MLIKEQKQKIEHNKKKRKNYIGMLALEGKNKELGALGFLYSIKGIIFNIVGKFIGHIYTDVVRLKIKVSADDASSCALLYGVVSQLTSYIMEFISKKTNMHRVRSTEIDVTADFNGDMIDADIYIVFRIRIIHIISTFLRLAFTYIKNADKLNKVKNKKKIK